jgi:hypothetical protein
MSRFRRPLNTRFGAGSGAGNEQISVGQALRSALPPSDILGFSPLPAVFDAIQFAFAITNHWENDISHPTKGP